MTLSARLQQLAATNQEVVFITKPQDAQGQTDQAPTSEVSVKLRVADWLESTMAPETPVSAPALGVAFKVFNQVVAILPGSPAEQAGLQVGDKLLAAELVIPQSDSDNLDNIPVELGDELNWPMLFGTLQRLPTGTQVKINYERNGAPSDITLQPVADPNPTFYVPERGFTFEPLRRIRVARTWEAQLYLGWDRTVESLLMVFRFLQKLGKQVPITALGGPVTIAKIAGYSAFQGIPSLLIFLTIISANLAVVNFLPIPLLDGGHMVFLIYEAIFRRPANERFVVAMHLAGFAFIITLMVFLLALDVGLIPRNLG